MRRTSNAPVGVGAILALQLLCPTVVLASDGANGAKASELATDRWIPSLSITSGVLVQKQYGSDDSSISKNGAAAVPLRPPESDDDLAVTPFVGGNVELLTPALPIPTRPRLFLAAEILPSFGANRTLALEGSPGCIRGPEPDAPCASEEDGTVRTRNFGEDAANGQGSKTTAEMDTLAFGVTAGVAFPFQIGKRELRIKPSFGWIHYKVTGKGLVVDATCVPTTVCTDYHPFPVTNPGFIFPGFLRETVINAKKSERFNGLGPGLDVEVDVGRFGPLGASLFAGGRAYHVFENRTIKFQTTNPPVTDLAGTNDVASARFKVEVNEWMYRGHVGIRFHWLGKN